MLLFLVVQKHFQRANLPFNMHVPWKTLMSRNAVGSVITTSSLVVMTSGSANIQQDTAEYPGDIQTHKVKNLCTIYRLRFFVLVHLLGIPADKYTTNRLGFSLHGFPHCTNVTNLAHTSTVVFPILHSLLKQFESSYLLHRGETRLV